MTAIAETVLGKSAILFDLFHTLTALEPTWPGGPETCEMLAA